MKGYTIIPDSLLDIDLDVYETIILSVIFGFSQDGESVFNGSWNYLAKKARCSRRKVGMALQRLVMLGLIEKKDVNVGGVKLCEYRVCTLFIGSACDAPGVVHVVHRGSACDAHNNIEDNIDKSISLSNKSKRFHKPTMEEIEQYCSERNNGIKAESFYNFYEAKGWKVGKNPMVDWKAAIRTWEQRERSEAKPRTTAKKESVYAHNLRVMQEINGMFHPNTNNDEQ